MLKLALAQINPTVGDISDNTSKIISYIKRAEREEADLIAFPELAITGYPPEDLINLPDFVQQNLSALDKILPVTKNITAVVGFIATDQRGRKYNSAAILSHQRTLGIYHKMHLPNYGVFDEKRYFTPGHTPSTFRVNKTIIGVNICEDIWVENGPTKQQVSGVGGGGQGRAKLIINISSSPSHSGKIQERYNIISEQASNNKVYIVYVNLVGGQDELVFDGRSMVFNPRGELIARAKSFAEDLLIVEIPNHTTLQPPSEAEYIEIYKALKLGLSDYCRKNGFKSVIIGLSGGIDSALTALIAVDALGSKNVIGFYLPSEFSSRLSQQYVIKLAKNLGIKLVTIPIKDIYQSFLKSLGLSKRGGCGKITLTEENLQSRIRGTILMAFSNKSGALVLTTGNKSELSTGYATLYGDMAGGFALLKDVPKTLVYKLSSHLN
ncbi:MAG: NAD+ synthase, partial [Planctomycetota bacterium]|nr:NAD+ synthase [Planctomycetota bacterium]MDI6787574.1 NAD+ synthase [Planctomycetota bacterium]